MSRAVRGAHLRYYQPQTCGRAQIERFVTECYARQYGARLADFFPHQLALFDEAGLRGCLGFRPADAGGLFLEQYLDAPVDTLLGGRLGMVAHRSDVVEVGGLAADWSGAARRLILMAIGWLGAAGYRIAAFTATRSLVNSFRRLQLQPLDLGLAEPSRLARSDTDWGRYYDHGPHVYAGLIGIGPATRVPAAAEPVSSQPQPC
ncbi:thermostable hemolysin [Salinisphaera sp. T31B1]|uniref:thermostable hemolysin n=1 Tax=Salinisphaera sp. T31B1 TaxID=727963 RepID=UPI003342A766